MGATHFADCERMLGYRFFPQEDKLSLAECYSNDESYESDNNISERLVLSTIAKVFDPIGFTNPVLAKAKIFLQKLWKLGVEWDEQINSKLASEWLKIVKDLALSPIFKFSRKCFGDNP